MISYYDIREKLNGGKHLTGGEMAEIIADWVNGEGGREMEEFAEKMVYGTHRTLQQQFFELMAKCIKHWARCLEHNTFDGRNQFTCEKSSKIWTDVLEEYDRVPLI